MTSQEKKALGVSALALLVQVVVYAVLTGAAYADLKSAIKLKADQMDMISVASDVKTIKAILCERAAQDSFCRVGKP